MKTKQLFLWTFLLLLPASEAFACAVCFGERGSKSGESMAMAIWFLLAAVMAVLAGISAFGFHLWRAERMPLEPHQALAEEDLEKYD